IIYPGSPYLFFTTPAVFNNALYFLAQVGNHTWLEQTDGTNVTQVIDLSSKGLSSTTNLTATGNALYLSAYDGTTGLYGLFQTDGISTLTNLTNGTSISYATPFTSDGNTLYFRAYTSYEGVYDTSGSTITELTSSSDNVPYI